MWIAAGIFVFFLVAVAVVYNAFISKRNMADNAFSTIDVMLKRRFDLVPNLVETVKGYARHEGETFKRLAEIRGEYLGGRIGDDEKIRLGAESGAALGRLLAVAESYPDLKASANFLNLQRNLTEIEEQISAARRAYNAAATDFNNSCEMFPTNVFAGVFGFRRRTLFSAPENEKESGAMRF